MTHKAYPEYTISKATEYNWRKLHSDFGQKLTARANKTMSKRIVPATNYVDYQPANYLLKNIINLNEDVGNIIYSLCVLFLKYTGIWEKENVQTFFDRFQQYKMTEIDIPKNLWNSENDILGFIYQSLITEGEKNTTGQYYTNRKIVERMLYGKVLKDGETFLDPCCGSGIFLLTVTTRTPNCLYGIDINPIAVMIAGTNLLVKYSAYNFVPNVFCFDFLQKDTLLTVKNVDLPAEFDNIYTNPPWGSDKTGIYKASFREIKSKERASMVIVEALNRLKDKGSFCFLLPTSLLKIKNHGDIRKYILNNTTITQIDLFSLPFDGVFTDYFSIELLKEKTDLQQYNVNVGNSSIKVSLSQTDMTDGNIVTEKLSKLDCSIIQKMEALRNDDLRHSKWALGIVTGDNKSKVKKEKSEGMELIYTGKQVKPFLLQKESSYILFAPKMFQQCAKEEFFRAKEKLIHRFIAKYPIVAYDDKQCLCLNSANIIIPEIEGISVKAVASLLNSTLYHYYYSLKFKDIKVLKSNLQELPFPKLEKQDDEVLSRLVSDIQKNGYSEKYAEILDKTVYSLFNITETEQKHIKTKLNI